MTVFMHETQAHKRREENDGKILSSAVIITERTTSGNHRANQSRHLQYHLAKTPPSALDTRVTTLHLCRLGHRFAHHLNARRSSSPKLTLH